MKTENPAARDRRGVKLDKPREGAVAHAWIFSLTPQLV